MNRLFKIRVAEDATKRQNSTHVDKKEHLTLLNEIPSQQSEGRMASASAISLENVKFCEEDKYLPSFFDGKRQKEPTAMEQNQKPFYNAKCPSAATYDLENERKTDISINKFEEKTTMDQLIHRSNIEDCQRWSRHHCFDSQIQQESAKSKGQFRPGVESKAYHYRCQSQSGNQTSTFKERRMTLHTSSTVFRQPRDHLVEDRGKKFIPKFSKVLNAFTSNQPTQQPYGRSAEVDDGLISRRRRSTRKSEVFEHSDLFKKERIETRVIMKRFGNGI